MTNFRTLPVEDDRSITSTLVSLVSTRFMEDDVDLTMIEITRHIKSLTELIVSEGNKLKSEERNICVLRKKVLHLEGAREEIVKNMKFGRKKNNQMKVFPFMMGINSDWINLQKFSKKCYYSSIVREASLKKVHELNIQINTLDETLKKARIAFYNNIRGLTNLKNDICKLHYFLMKIKDKTSIIESPEVNNEVLEGNIAVDNCSNPDKYIGVGVNKLLLDCMRTLKATKKIAMRLQDTEKKMCVPNDMSVKSDEHQDSGITIEELFHEEPEERIDIEFFHEETEKGMEKQFKKKEIILDELEKSFQEAHAIVDDIVEQESNKQDMEEVDEDEENDEFNQVIQNRDIETRYHVEIERNPNSMDIEIKIHKKSDRQFNYVKNQLHKNEVREEIRNGPPPKTEEECTGDLTEARDEAPASSDTNHAHILKVPSLNQNKSDKEPVEARNDAETFLDNLINQGSGGLRTNNSDNEITVASEENKSDKGPAEMYLPLDSTKTRSDTGKVLHNLINQGSGGLRTNNSDNEITVASEENKSDKGPAEMYLPLDSTKTRSDTGKVLHNLINQGSGGLRTNNSDNEVTVASEDGSLCSNQSNMSANMDSRLWALKLASYSGSVGNLSDVTINENSPGPLKIKLSDDLAATLMNNQETTLSELCCEMSSLEPYLLVTEERDEHFELSNNVLELGANETLTYTGPLTLKDTPDEVATVITDKKSKESISTQSKLRKLGFLLDSSVFLLNSSVKME